jgi:hypothetical protein
MGDGLLADVVPVGAVSFDRVVQVPSGGQDARVDDEWGSPRTVDIEGGFPGGGQLRGC